MITNLRMLKILIALFLSISINLFAQNGTIKIRKSDSICGGNISYSDTALVNHPFKISKIIVEGITSQKGTSYILNKLDLHTGQIVTKEQIKTLALNICFYENFTLQTLVVKSSKKKGSAEILLKFIKDN